MKKHGGKILALLICASALLRSEVEAFPASPRCHRQSMCSGQRNGSGSCCWCKEPQDAGGGGSVLAAPKIKPLHNSVALQCVQLESASFKPYLSSSRWSCHLWHAIAGNHAINVVSGERKTVAGHHLPPRSFYRGEKPSPSLLRGRRCNSKGFWFRIFLSLNKIRRSVLTPGFPFLSC